MTSAADDVPPQFTLREICWRTAVFFGAFAAANKAVHLARRFVEFDCPRYWPLSVFNERWPRLPDVLVAVFVAALGVFVVRLWERTNYRTGIVAAAGLLLILGTNAIQGMEAGFVTPIAGGGAHGIQYYHDARRSIPDGGAITFLRHFNAKQPELLEHGRTHPPGAVLIFHALRRLTGDRPAVVALLVAATATLFSAYFFRTWIAQMLPGTDARRTGFLTAAYLLLPAVQIYYAATLDALIAMLLLGVAALYLRRPASSWPATIGAAAALLFLAAFVSFGVVWVLPVLLAADFYQQDTPFRRPLRPVLRLGLLLLPVALAFIGLRAASGFDYLQALATASRLENPNGFRLLQEPASYLFTRLEDIGEIVFFAGPFLLALFWRGLPTLKSRFPAAFAALVAALGTLTFLFASGAYRTGETARACLFVYPYLLLPVGAAFPATPDGESAPSSKVHPLLLYLLLAQTIFQQMFGRYFW